MTTTKSAESAFTYALATLLQLTCDMRRLHDRLELESKNVRAFHMAGQRDEETEQAIQSLSVQMDELWKKTQAARDHAQALVILPPFPIKGFEPKDWQHQQRELIDTITEVVGGRFPKLVKSGMTEAEKTRFVDLHGQLEPLFITMRNLLQTPLAETNTSKPPKKRGRHGLSSTEEARRKEHIAGWQRAKSTGVSMKVYCEDKQISMKDLQTAMNWKSQRGRRGKK